MNVNDILESGLLELYVLDELSATERSSVETWATQYPEVKTELTLIEKGIEELALSQASPLRAGLKDDVISKIGKEIQNKDLINPKPAAKTFAESKNSSAIKVEPETRDNLANHAIVIDRSINKPSVAAKTVLPWFLSAALAISSFYYYNELQKERVKSQSCEVSQHQNAKTYVETERALNILKNSDTKTVPLLGLKNSPESKVNVYWNAKKAETMLSIVNLPAPPEKMQYQLWAIVDKKPVSAGVLEYSTEALQFMRGFDKAEAFAITLEKEGGSEAPTLDKMYVMGTL